jgi:hypothetical protein
MQTTKAGRRPIPPRGTAASLPCRVSVIVSTRPRLATFRGDRLFILPVHGAFPSRGTTRAFQLARDAVADNSTYFSPRLISAIAAPPRPAVHS